MGLPFSGRHDGLLLPDECVFIDGDKGAPWCAPLSEQQAQQQHCD